MSTGSQLWSGPRGRPARPRWLGAHRVHDSRGAWRPWPWLPRCRAGAGGADPWMPGPWENHGKTMGKPWENGDFMGKTMGKA